MHNTAKFPGAGLLAALTAVAAVAAGLAVAPTAAATPQTSLADGATPATAAASCWEVKQNVPNAKSGVYWIGTPELGAPQQFRCDQDFDGGGWVLIGRGREGWSESGIGAGTADQVHTPASGPAAFAPRQLPAATVDALLNGASVNDTADGIRLRRATTTAGDRWQNVTFNLAGSRDGWSWHFNNAQRVRSWKIDTGASGTGGRTSEFGSGNTTDKVNTIADQSHGAWRPGFGFGKSTTGDPGANSYIWSAKTSDGFGRPFTEVWLRPKLMSQDVFSPIGEQGTPVRVNTPGADSFARPQPWGVSGLGNGPRNLEGSNEVSAFAQVGDTVFVGGNFTKVQRTSSGGDQADQAYLAAFNAKTGEWIPGFRPKLDNQVKALAALPDGRLAVGGYFGTVNGESRPALAVLNASTGKLDAKFTGGLINRISGQPLSVRSLDVEGQWLYAGGSFSHSTGGKAGEVYTRAAARFAVSDGTPAAWNPELNGSVMSLDASERGDRVYVAGYFTTARGKDAEKAAALRVDDAEPLAWQPTFSNPTNYQQAIKEVGDRVWVGGSQHSLFSYDRSSFKLANGTITQSGGDFQAIATNGKDVYAGCHCFDTAYDGTTQWPVQPNTTFSTANRINGIGQWSNETATYKPAFSPELDTRAGAGAWAVFVDKAGDVWAGGDFSYTVRADRRRQWTGGFVRFAPVDVSPPSTPTNFTATGEGDEIRLSWAAASGNPARYEVLRDDRVVASTTRTTASLPSTGVTSNYFVRAVDAAGNRSPSTPALPVEPPAAEPQDSQLIAEGAEWRYRFETAGPPSNWAASTFDDASWAAGNAPLGWGQAKLGTTLTSTASKKPLASFYRRSFELTDAGRLKSVRLTTRADDGVIVYVNGQEVLRQNMKPGESGISAYATKAVSAADALANPVEVTVPADKFVTGRNVIAIEVHSNYSATPSHSAELSAVATWKPVTR